MKYLMFPVLLGLGLAGCSQAKTDATLAPAEPTAAPAPELVETTAPTATTAATTTAPALPGNPTVAPAGPKSEAVATANAEPGHAVVYQAELNMAVDDFDQATDRVNALLEQHGAYLGTAHESRADGQRRQEMTLKVPPRQFVPLVAALGKLGHIENKDISSADITADVLSAATHLDEQKTAETQLSQQLARATAPTDRARLAGEIRRQRFESAATQAQLQQFGARAEWATLTLHYYQVLPATEHTAPEPPVAPRFRQAFGWGWALLLELAVALAYAWPALLLAAMGAWGLRRWRLRQSLPA